MITQLGAEYHGGGNSGGGGGAPVMQERRTSPDEVTFLIARNNVGGLIGKGGQALKDLQLEFGIRVYVEKEEVNGMRLVVLKPMTSEPAGETEKAAMALCQQKILTQIQAEESASLMKEE